MAVKPDASPMSSPVVMEATDVASAAEHATPKTDAVRVLHVISVSVPHLNGYTMRSRYIVETQKRSGTAVPTVVTSPFYPGNIASQHDDVIDGTMYHRIPHPTDLTTGRRWDDRLCIACFRLRKGIRGRGPAVRRALRNALLAPLKRRWRRSYRWSRRQVIRVTKPVHLWWKRRSARWRRSMRKPIRHMLRRTLRTLRWFHQVLYRRRFYQPLGARILAPFKSMVRAMLTRRQSDEDIAGEPGRLGRFFRGVGRVFATIVAAPVVAVGAIGRGIRGCCSFNGWIRRSAWTLEAIEELCIARRFRRDLLRIVEQERPDIIHAHSPYRCGRPAVEVGRRTGIPVVYEIRGLWEDSGVAQGNFVHDSAKYRFWRRNETYVMQHADAIICICEALRREVIERGVPPERTFVAPNAVDSDQFQPARLDRPENLPHGVRRVAAQLRGVTVGYVGSIRKLEGVDETVRGVAELIRQGVDASLLIVGDGPGLNELRELADQYALGDRAIFTGRVPHDVVRHYYALIDVFVVSRPALRVTNMVTPLKPLEAMAMGKAILVSDLPALREIVRNEKTGLTYEPGNLDDFTRQCRRYIEDAALRQEIADMARRWVRRERTWEVAQRPTVDAYTAVLPARTTAGRSDGGAR